MSILRLLATGRSLRGMQNTNNPYRMRTENLLPKFISPKNPFAQVPKPETTSAAKAAPARLDTGLLFDSAPQPTPPANIKDSKPLSPQPVKTELKPVSDSAPITISAPAIPIRKSESRFAWIGKLNPLALWPSRGGTASRSSRVRSGRNQVQTELSLDKVRVVRNDLSNTDLEIVPGKLMGLPSGASPVLSQAQRMETGAWGRLASKFLGAEQASIR